MEAPALSLLLLDQDVLSVDRSISQPAWVPKEDPSRSPRVLTQAALSVVLFRSKVHP
jgi:hypothetical protein